MMRATEPLLRVEGLAKSYVQRRPMTDAKYVVRAFEDVSLTVSRGTTLAIVGESGAGKSSLARCMALLENADRGEIWYQGKDVAPLPGKSFAAVRREIQLIFQDATTALNTRFTAAEIVAEPLVIQRVGTRTERRERAIELMRRVGLSAESAEKSPLELSGGQRQRLAIARALALEPRLLILDEALSSLDQANQQMMVRLLAELQKSHGLTYVHVSHDLWLVAQFAEEVAVMYAGKIVERAPASQLFARPEHPYTRDLLGAMPSLESILVERSA
jgi:ABC-type glutathione transport system ATPase component